MAVFNCSVVTTKGKEIIIDAIAGKNITFTKMIVGCGIYGEEERTWNSLENRESMKDAKQEFTFSAYKKESEQCYKLTAIISNRELVESYKITEIGIYAKRIDDEEDTLFAISITRSVEESDTLPPYNGLQPCEIVQDYFVTISRNAEVKVVTKGASVLTEDFFARIEELKKEFTDKIEELKRSFQAGVDRIYNFLKGLGFTPADKSPDGICNAIQKVYDDRYTTGRSQGREDVKDSPETYGVSTASKLAQLVTPGFQMEHNTAYYTCQKTGTYHIRVQYINMNNGNHNGCHTLIRLTVPGSTYTFVNCHYDYDTNGFINDNVNASNGQTITVNANAGSVFSLEVGGNEISAGYDGDAQLKLFYATAMWEIY